MSAPYRIFCSYHTPDEGLARGLSAALQAGSNDIEVFFAPESLRAGNFWLPRLSDEIRRSNAFLCLLGARTGNWQLLEYYEAFDRWVKEKSFPFVPVIVAEKAPAVPFLNQVHWISSLTPAAGPDLERILAALKGAPARGEATPLWEIVNPYRGLQALDEAHADYFFGRDEETQAILDALATRPTCVAALVGNSGVGKSSLAQAGVIASLKRCRWPGDKGSKWPQGLKGSRGWLYLSMKPGEHPLRSLAAAFVRHWYPDPTDPKRSTRAEEWGERLGKAGSLQDLIEATQERFDELGLNRPSRILLYVDQGEELYARSLKEERQRFSALLSGAVAQGELLAFASLRSDYYGYLQEDAALFAQSQRIDVPPLSASGFREAIGRPASCLQVSFESEALIDQIVRASVDQPGALPLIADLLTDLWGNMQARGDGVLRWSDRPELIQIGIPLANKADAFLAAHPDQTQSIRRLLTYKLVHVPVDGEPVRRRVRRSECDDQEWGLIEELAHPDTRLVVTSAEGGDATAEVAHEVLLKEWPALKRWIETEHDFLVWKGQLEQDRRMWEEAGEGDKAEALLMGLPLTRAEQWLATRPQDDIAAADTRFIHDSIETRDRKADAEEQRRQQELKTAQELAEQREARAAEAVARTADAERSSRRQKRLSWALGAIAAVSIGLAVYVISLAADLETQTHVAVAEKDRANTENERANAELDNALRSQSRYLAREAAAQIDIGSPALGVLLALEALHQSPSQVASPPDGTMQTRPLVSEAVTQLHNGLQKLRERQILLGHNGWVPSVDFSPDGTRVVSGSGDNTIRVWAADGSGAPLVLKGHEGGVRSVAFSPDGTRIVSGSDDASIRVWASDGSGAPLELKGHEGPVLSVAFSPDGKRILSGSRDQTIRVWAADSSSTPLVLKGHKNDVNSVAFSPDSTRIVSGSDDNTIRVWAADGGGNTLVFKGHENDVSSVAFSPDGTLIVSGSWDNTIRVWAAQGSGAPLVLKGHERPVASVAFSPDGTRIVSGSFDKTIRIWVSDGNGEPPVLKGHEDWVTSIALSPDGKRIVSGSSDSTIRVWTADESDEPLVLKGHEGWVTSVALSPDGTRIVSGSRDNTIRVWAADGSGAPLVLKGHEGSVNSVAFSPEGRRIVSSSGDGTIRVWAADGSGTPLELKGDQSFVHSVAFSPEGTRVVSGSYDNTVRVWAADGSGTPLVLKGHEDDVNSVAFSPDGRRIGSGSEDDTIRVWAADGSGEPLVLKGHEDDVTSVAFSSDGTRIGSGSEDDTIRVWASGGRGENLVLRGQQSDVTSVAFNSDGTRIVSGSDDGTIRVWAADGSGTLQELKGHDGKVNSVAFSPDGTRIVSGSHDFTVRVWLADDKLLIDRAISLIPRCLTPEEREKYFLDAADPPWCERFKPKNLPPAGGKAAVGKTSVR